MGALIFLLLVTTRRIRLQTIARAHKTKVEPSEQDPESPAVERLDQDDVLEQMQALPPEPVPIDWQPIIATLTEQRNARIKRLDEQLRRLSTMKTKLRDTRKYLSETERRLEHVQSDQRNNSDAAKTTEAQQTSVTKKIHKTRKRFEQFQRQQALVSSKYTFIAYDGKSGTTRRPILIECTDTSLRFLPEDVVLTPSDLKDFIAEYNPLLAGSRALTRFWTDWNCSQPQPDAQPEPYVLLLVRPSGCFTFYIARTFLENLGTSYGYELIEEDWNVLLPKAIPEATTVCREAVANVLAERDKVIGNRSASGRPRIPQRGTSRFQFDADRLDRRSRAAAMSAKDSPSNDRFSTNVVPSFAKSNRAFGSTASDRFFNSEDFQRRGSRQKKTLQRIQSRSLNSDRVSIDERRTRNQSGQPFQENSDSLEKPSANSRKSAPQSMKTNLKHLGRISDEAIAERPQLNPANESEQFGQAGSTNATSESGIPSNSKVGILNGKMSTVSERMIKNPDKSASADTSLQSPFPKFGTLSIADSAGRNMTNSEQHKRWVNFHRRAGIGFERPMTIQIQAGRVIVDWQTIISVGNGETRDEVLLSVLNGIDQHLRSWEAPPSGFYWIPAIKFVVSPGGNQHYVRLHDPLRQVGLSSTVQFTLESSASEYVIGVDQ